MDNISEEERDLRKALQYDILNIVLQQDATSGMRTTTGAIRALTELVWQYMHHAMIPDLVAFSNHAKSRTISTDDVGLLLRKLPDKLEQFQRQFPTNNSTIGGVGGGGRSGMAAAAPRSSLSGRRSLPLSPSTTSGKNRSSIIGTSAVTNNARERDREREYQDLLLASSDEEDDDGNKNDNNIDVENNHNSSKLPPPRQKRREFQLESDSSMSLDDESAIDNNDTSRDNSSAKKLPATVEKTRHSFPPTTATKRSHDRQARQPRKVLQDVPINTSDENDEGHSTSSSKPAASGTREDDVRQKRAFSRATSSDDDAPVMAPKIRKLQKRQAIEDDDEEESTGGFGHNMKTKPNQSSAEKQKYDDLVDSPTNSPAHSTSDCSMVKTSRSSSRPTNEPVKSQVAEILADLSYDSGPESTDPFHDDDM